MRRKAAVLLCALAAVTVLAVPAARASNASVSIVDYSFQPGSVTINVGESVTWTHTGSATHTVTGDGFDSGNLSTGQTYTHTFSQPGTFGYYCKYHGSPGSGMHGTVTVQGSAPPATQPPATAPPQQQQQQPAAEVPPRATAAPTTAAPTTTTVAPSTTTTIAPPAAADGTTSSTTAAVGGGVALPAQKASSGGGGNGVSGWLIALAVILVGGAATGGVLLRRRAV